MNITEKSLSHALAHFGLSELPEAWDKGSVWVYAIAKVVKRNGETSYAMSRRCDGGKFKLVKDFGSTEAIYKVTEYYPTIYLKQSFMPNVRTKEECISYLTSVDSYYYKASEISDYDYDKLLLMVVDYAVKQQIKQEEFNSTVADENIEAKTIKEEKTERTNNNGKRRNHKKD